MIILNILVIGNGFDLAHGLPTRYSDLLEFITAFKYWYQRVYNHGITPSVIVNRDEFEKKLEKISENGFINFRELTDEQNEYVREFYELVCNNSWIDYFYNRLKENEKYGKEYNWVDIEEEILKFIKIITECQKINPIFNDISFDIADDKDGYFHLSEIEKGLSAALFHKNLLLERRARDKEKWMKFKIDLRKQFEKVIRALEIYLSVFLRKDIKLNDQLEQIKFDKIISFNYTDTYKIYNKNIEYEYVHGNANIDRPSSESNIVLGMNEFLNDAEKDERLDFIDYRKYYQRIIKRNDIGYKSKFMPQYHYPDKVITYFFGHSMSVTDIEVLKYLLPTGKNDVHKSIICYYNENTFKSQIVNLIRILGQDKLQELMAGEDPSIELIKQDDLLSVYNRINDRIIQKRAKYNSNKNSSKL